MDKALAYFNRRRFALLAALPAVLILLAITIFPLIYAVRISFFDYYLPRPHLQTFVGGANYAEVLKDPRFWASLKQTGILLGGSISLEFLLGLGIALLIFGEVMEHPVFKRFIPIILIPMMVAPVIVGYMWRLLYNVEAGPINYLLGFIGLGPYAWTANVTTALPSIIIADVWQWTPFVVLVMLAGLVSLPNELFEAAAVDGASAWQRLIHIILPMLKRLIAIVLLIRTLDAFRMFDKIFIMTQGGPGTATETASFYAYFAGFKYFRVGYAAAMAFLLLVVTVIITMSIAKVLHREE
ncbi:MAG: carbohydrate ABC transporter permease [Candidatus Bipolaricaulia bacterium]